MDIFDWLSEKGIPYKNKDLIMNAFVHSSYVNEHKTFLDDNERLEFMGDAVLQVWTTTKLFLLEPPLHEGEMTTLRAQLVCEEALAQYTRCLLYTSDFHHQKLLAVRLPHPHLISEHH